MTALEACKIELDNVQHEMRKYVSDCGFVRTGFRNQYLDLMKDERRILECIDYLNNLESFKKLKRDESSLKESQREEKIECQN